MIGFKMLIEIGSIHLFKIPDQYFSRSLEYIETKLDYPYSKPQHSRSPRTDHQSGCLITRQTVTGSFLISGKINHQVETVPSALQLIHCKQDKTTATLVCLWLLVMASKFI